MLTVTERAPTQDLTILEVVKAEFEITASTDDAVLAILIRQASGMISTFCNRVFGLESLVETFRLDPYCVGPTTLRLARAPVITLTSVVEDGVGLTPGTDYEVETEEGRLVRLLSDWETNWWARKIEVTYSAGYTLLTDLPYDVERACIDLVRRLYLGRSRDPALRAERILDVVETQWTAADSVETLGGLPIELARRLIPYRRVE